MGAAACFAAGPGSPPQRRCEYIPASRSRSMCWRMKLVTCAPSGGVLESFMTAILPDRRRGAFVAMQPRFVARARHKVWDGPKDARLDSNFLLQCSDARS